MTFRNLDILVKKENYFPIQLSSEANRIIELILVQMS